MEGGDYQRRRRVCLPGGTTQPKRMVNFHGRKTTLPGEKGMESAGPGRVPVAFCCSALWMAGVISSLTVK